MADDQEKLAEQAARRFFEQIPLKPDDHDAEIKRLAKLSLLDYERIRGTSAANFGIRVTALDSAVMKLQKANKKSSQALTALPVEAAAESADGSKLLDAIKDVFEKYVVLPPHTAEAIALWIMHTWAIDAVDISPILAIISPEKRCGKTTVLKLLNRLTRRASLASNISTAALFRYIEAEQPTLLIDEGDSFLKDNEEMRGVLNSGHSREAAYVIRCEGDDMAPRRFSTWGPKAIAAIKKLPSTLTDRSITVPMRRKLKTEKRPRYRDKDQEQFQILRSQALRWTDDNRKLLPDDPPVPEALDDRAADNWRPLLAIAKAAGGEWPEIARIAALALSGATDDTLGVRLLTDIKWILEGKPRKDDETGGIATEFDPPDKIFSAVLVGHLIGIEDSPWAVWHKKGFTQTTLADLLDPFHIKPSTVRIGDTTLKGYTLASFSEAFGAYVDDTASTGGLLPVTPSQPNKDGPNLQTSAVTLEMHVTAGQSQKPAPNGHCYPVTDKMPPVEGGTESADQKPFLYAGTDADDEANRVCAQCRAGPLTDPPSDLPTKRVKDGDAVEWLHTGHCHRIWMSARAAKSDDRIQ